VAVAHMIYIQSTVHDEVCFSHVKSSLIRS